MLLNQNVHQPTSEWQDAVFPRFWDQIGCQNKLFLASQWDLPKDLPGFCHWSSPPALWQQSIRTGWSQRSFPVIPWLNSKIIHPILVPVHCSIPIFVLGRKATASTPALMKSSLKLQCKKIPKSSMVSTSQIIHYQLCCSGWQKELVQQAMTDSFLLKNGTIWQSRIAIPHYPGPPKHFCSLSKAHERPADVDRVWERIWTTAVAQLATMWKLNKKYYNQNLLLSDKCGYSLHNGNNWEKNLRGVKWYLIHFYGKDSMRFLPRITRKHISWPRESSPDPSFCSV